MNDPRHGIVRKAVLAVTRWSPAARRYADDMAQAAWVELLRLKHAHPGFQLKIARAAAWAAWRRHSAPVTLHAGHRPHTEPHPLPAPLDEAPIPTEPQSPELRIAMYRAMTKLPRKRPATIQDMKRVWKPLKKETR